MRFNIISLFPEMFPGSLGFGLIGKALKNKQFNLNIIDLKKYSINNRVDDRPFGGGPGMVIKPEILANCFDDNNLDIIFFLSPRGMVFNQKMAEFLVGNFDNINLLCGRYEGIDHRLFKKYKIIEISLGDFILCGGESAALTIIECLVRTLPGVLNNNESISDESFNNYLLEHNHYTHPKIWEGYDIPEILISGNHEKVFNHRFKESLQNTYENRFDLYCRYYSLIYDIFMTKFIKKFIFKKYKI